MCVSVCMYVCMYIIIIIIVAIIITITIILTRRNIKIQSIYFLVKISRVTRVRTYFNKIYTNKQKHNKNVPSLRCGRVWINSYGRREVPRSVRVYTCFCVCRVSSSYVYVCVCLSAVCVCVYVYVRTCVCVCKQNENELGYSIGPDLN